MRRAGFTLLELAVTLTVIGMLASLGLRSLHDAVERAREARAISDLQAIESAVQQYLVTEDRLPASLAEIGFGNTRDPWGRAYVYQPFSGTGWKGRARKDRFLVPLNSDFDLYSKGADGMSAPALTAAASRDDIIRADDGSFIGRAEEY